MSGPTCGKKLANSLGWGKKLKKAASVDFADVARNEVILRRTHGTLMICAVIDYPDLVTIAGSCRSRLFFL